VTTTPDRLGIEQVADDGICTACGTCAGLCPAGAIRMSPTADRRLAPTVDASACTRCGLCERACPALHAPARLNQPGPDQPAGACQAGWLGRANDDAWARAGASGGLVRALLAWAMERRLAKHVVFTRPSAGDPLAFEAALTDDPADLLSQAGSIYCPLPVNAVLNHVQRADGPVAYVGLGCHMQGLERACEVAPALGPRIALRVGLFCSGTMTFAAQDFLIGRSGLRRDRVRTFVYRDKSTGWPGDVRVEDGQRTRHVSTDLRTAGKSFFIPPYCRLCPDKMNVLADLAVGDAYGLCDDNVGLAEIVAHTAVGREALERAAAAGFVTLRPHDAADIARRQAARSYARRAAAMASAWRAAGGRLPDIWRQPAFWARLSAKASLRWRIALALVRRMHTPAGQRLLSALPGWLVRAYSLTVRGLVALAGWLRPGAA
jgi:coenzyme F420 hydrogenase subunit beta